MKLSSFLAKKGIHKATFAGTVGVTYMAVHYWMRGARIPRPAHMRKIIKATRGAVQPNDFLSSREAAE
jgi:DNA-binding transcriptional regulator YdaS (Cro superfamily)